MSKKKEDAKNNPSLDDPVSLELCEAYRKALEDKINDLKDDLKSIDSRTWQILAGVLVTIALAVLTVIVSYLT